MALSFTGSSNDRVDTPDAAAVNDFDPWSFWCWGKTASFVTGLYLFSKGDFTGSGFKIFDIDAPTTALYCEHSRATANCIRSAAHGMSTNAWQFMAARFSASNGIDILVGDLTTDAVELTGGTDTVGSGTPEGDTPCDRGFTVGNSSTLDFGFGTRGWNGEIAIAGYHNTFLSDGELIAMQWRPQMRSDMRVYWQLGLFGLANPATDWSGSGSVGTQNGTVLADHVPLGPPFGFDELLLPVPAEDVSHVAALADSFDNVVQRRPIKITSY